MFINLIGFLIFQSVAQLTARTAVDLVGKLDKTNQPLDANAISASNSVISSSNMGPLPESNTLHCHSKRGLKCEKCGTSVKQSESASTWDCRHIYHSGCAEKLVKEGEKNCLICKAEFLGGFPPWYLPQNSNSGGSVYRSESTQQAPPHVQTWYFRPPSPGRYPQPSHVTPDYSQPQHDTPGYPDSYEYHPQALEAFGSITPQPRHHNY
ncbi:hypothetical protein PGT21_030543 [Puccinia graminis f. sp. tritici]|uniref:RING-type domain-containing protein n=1 Tax=Puccinia graminis f. sp. tritici TaxID=56615 RepID=A0A5B0PKS2_PUCGR|nr:hypothetical protein PGT21_030543 [Puccinia graminis f. sp. tritici]